MKPQIVSFRCVLKNSAGDFISSTYSRDVLTANPASESVALPALADRMQNLKDGEKRKIDLAANEAYGLYQPSLVVRMPRAMIPGSQRVRVGDRVTLGADPERIFRVTEAIGNELTLDANHPLAGQDLTFNIEVIAARDATEDETRDVPIFNGQQYLN